MKPFFRQDDKKKIWIRTLQAIVSLGLLVLLVFQINLQEFYSTLKNFSLGLLIGLPLIFLINNLIITIRWKVLLDNLGIHSKLGRLFLTNFISIFWSNFLPTTLGSDGYRILKTRVTSPGQDKEVVSSVLLDRLYGYATLVGLHFILVLFHLTLIRNNAFLWWTEWFILLSIPFAIFLWMQRRKITGWRFKRWQWLNGLLEKMDQVIPIIEKQTWLTVVAGTATSILSALISGWIWGIYYLAVGVKTDWLLMQYISTLSSISGMLPISINGIGIVEFIQTTIMHTQNIPIETVILATLSYRTVSLLMSLCAGALHLIQMWNKKLQTVVKLK